jgi:hypothetical protein
VADQDPQKPPKADPARVPGLLDQYRQQRAAWLAQADELVRMRDEVRHAAEREAIEIVTTARRDVRRIIVEARRELLVLTAQLHAAVEATDAPAMPPPPFTALLPDPDRSRVEDASHDTSDLTRDVVLEARRGVRSVLDEARAEIEALSSEAPAALAAASAGAPVPGAFEAAAGEDEPRPEGPVHELNLDAALSSLDYQTRDLPIPTLARILGTEEPRDDQPDDPTGPRSGFAPLSFDTPELSELRSLLRDSGGPLDSPPGEHSPVLTPDVEPSPAAPLAFDTTPRSDFFDTPAPADASASADGPTAPAAATTPDDEADEKDEREDSLDTPRFTPPVRMFGEDGPPSRLFGDDTETRTPTRSARTFVGLFAATGAIAIAGTLWWALTREGSEPLSAAAPVVGTDVAKTAGPAPATPAPAPRTPGTMSLTIEARRPSWIRAKVDGKDETGRLYQAGETRHIEGAHAVSIRAGDAGAVFVGVDGASARALGANGVATTRDFAATPVATPAVATMPTARTGAAPAAASAPIVQADAPLAPARPDARPQPPSAAAATAAAPAPPEPPPTAEVSGARPDLVQAGQQWLSAYQRRDREAMAVTGTDNITVSDERSVTERFPAWQSNVRRDLDQVELELTGDTALLTARMTEHAEGGEHVSRVSQIWLRRNGRWRLADVRIIGEARLNQIIR